MAYRFGRVSKECWKFMVLNENIFNQNFKKRKGRFMFPTSHDITLDYGVLECSIKILEKILKAKNTVLITTKPWPTCIDTITKKFEAFKAQILFRFTITSNYDRRLKFWEPNAPLLDDRLNSVLMAKIKGYKTSASIEPFLDKDPTKLILNIAPYITDTIWLGKMNYIDANGISPEEKRYYEYQRQISSWSNIQKIVEKIKQLPEDIKAKIRLKDTI
ncbi:hypothetical protein LCGC14_3140480, partial [marine sediment metagenome]